MNAMPDLERAYRRLLRWYPRAFRVDHEDEIVGVLLDGAQEDQRHPTLAERFDLIGGAARLRLQPRVPHSARAVFIAVKMLYVGALVELVVAAAVVSTMGDVRLNAQDRNPRYSAAEWHAAVLYRIVPPVAAAVVAVLFWLVIAWAVGRGHNWPRFALAVFLVLNLVGLARGIGAHAAAVARLDLAAGIVLCAVELAALVLVFRATAVTPRAAR